MFLKIKAGGISKWPHLKTQWTFFSEPGFKLVGDFSFSLSTLCVSIPLKARWRPEIFNLIIDYISLILVSTSL